LPPNQLDTEPNPDALSGLAFVGPQRQWDFALSFTQRAFRVKDLALAQTNRTLLLSRICHVDERPLLCPFRRGVH